MIRARQRWEHLIRESLTGTSSALNLQELQCYGVEGNVIVVLCRAVVCGSGNYFVNFDRMTDDHYYVGFGCGNQGKTRRNLVIDVVWHLVLKSFPPEEGTYIKRSLIPYIHEIF